MNAAIEAFALLSGLLAVANRISPHTQQSELRDVPHHPESLELDTELAFEHSSQPESFQGQRFEAPIV
jgi:hypothetical protein